MNLYAALELPGWAPWVSLIWCAVVILAITRVSVALAFRIGGHGTFGPDAHWTEQARRAYSARIAAAVVAGVVALYSPGILFRVVGPSGLVGFGALSLIGLSLAWLGFGLGRRGYESRLLGRKLRLGEWLRGSILFALMRSWFLLGLSLAFLFPMLPLWLWLPLVAGAALFVVDDGFVRIFRRLGWLRPASPQTTAAVRRAVADGEALRSVEELLWHQPNAVALTRHGGIAFTSSALAVLDEREITSVARHELGHLREPESSRLLRSLYALLMFGAAAGFGPASTAFGLPGAAASFGILVVVHFGFRPLFTRLEERADAYAHEAEDDATYARALEKLYRAAVTPVVIGRVQRSAHPELFDRLTASGLQPEYPRPRPPSTLRSGAGIVAGVVCAALVYFVASLVPWAATVLDPEASIIAGTIFYGPSPEMALRLAELRSTSAPESAAEIARRAVAGSEDPALLRWAARILGRTHHCSEAADLVRRSSSANTPDAVQRRAYREISDCFNAARAREKGHHPALHPAALDVTSGSVAK